MHPESKRVMAKLADFGTCFNGRTTVGRVVDNPAWLAPEVKKAKEKGKDKRLTSFTGHAWKRLWRSGRYLLVWDCTVGVFLFGSTESLL